MKARRPFLFQSMASIIDQALLSGLNFLIGIALIRYASKETYGLYSQLFGVGLLTTTLLDALIGAALTTLSARLSPDDRVSFVARTARIHWVVSAALAALAGTGVWAFAETLALAESSVALGLAFAAFTFSLASREYCRTALFIRSHSDVVAKLDLVFVVLTLLGATLLLLVDNITVTEIICLLATSNGIAAALYSRSLVRDADPNTHWKDYSKDVRALWSLSRWAVAGSVLGWFGNNSYLYFVGGLVGVAALADLNAARLLLMPIVIVGMAWSRVARPAMGQMIANSDWEKLRRFVLKSFMTMEGITIVYVVVLLTSFPWLSSHILGGKYRDILVLLMLWGCYFAANAARIIGTTVLTSLGAFRALFWQGLVSVFLLVLMWSWWIPQFGAIGGVSAMIVVELGELLANHLYLLPRAKAKLLVLE